MKPNPNASLSSQHPVVRSAPWHVQQQTATSESSTMPAPEVSARVEKHEYSSQPQMKSEIFDAKVKLAKMILQHEEYLQLLNRATAASDSSENTENIDYEELTRIRDQIKITLSELSSESQVKRIKQLQARQKRKRDWKRRHIKKLQKTRDERKERRLRLHEETDRWRVEWIEKEAQYKKKLQERLEANKKRKLEASIQNRAKNNQLLVQKLLELRTIRRNKLKAQGHFFPDEGNEFYEHIRKLNELEYVVVEEESIDESTDVVTIHEDDKWIHQDLDTDSYNYWCQASSSLDSLKRARRQWDYYVSNSSGDIDGKLPPTWVQPSPPSNWVWATVLK